MKKFIALSVLAVLFTFSFVYASNDGDKKKDDSAVNTATTISGQVIDEETGEALTGVLVKINNTGEETYTDFDGNFAFTGVKPGDYDVVTKLISYQVHVDKNVKVEKSLKKNLTISLKKK